MSAPRSATGRSSLVEPLPHHISADSLHVAFRADPARIARFLPPGLEPLETGEGWAMIAEMAKVSAAAPEQAWEQPGRSTYNEGLVGFYCRFGERIGRYTAFVWVDRDWSLGMGAIFGWSKRLAQVDRTRPQHTNPGLPGLGPGCRLGGTVQRQGHTVLSLQVELPPNATTITALPGYAAASFLYRYVPSPSPDVPDVEQLFDLPFSNVTMSPIWAGTGSIRFGEAPDEEIAELGEVEVTGGYIYQRGWTTDRVARLLHDYQASGKKVPSAA
ncbi:MAG: acetoacetate decarboxylase family protein [Alphaproteobacteria bacterium]|nr:acetoacetate decarboxylase family protein [Alphaproteobacteria bacterium]